uniref:Variant surface glycoprotein n=1 Tax=Trypanosoma brucei TaxID=5691 RepID=A0A1V0FY14_9TRYP|nr:variant surface glycoprotein [Trypanosoma brucei]
MTQTASLIAASLVVLVAQWRYYVRADSPADEAVAAASDECKAVLYLEALADHMQGKLLSAQEELWQRRQETASITTAIAAAMGTPKVTGYGILAGLAINFEAQAALNVRAAEATYPAAIAQLRNLSTRIRTAAQLQSRSETTKGTVTTADSAPAGAASADAHCTYTDTVQKGQPLQCDAAQLLAGALSKTKITTEGLTKIPYVGDDFEQQTKMTVVAYAKGTPTGNSLAQRGWVCSASAEAREGTISGTHALGAIIQLKKLTAQISTVKLTGADEATNCEEPKPTDAAAAATKKRFLSAVCKALKTKIQPTPSAYTLTTAQLKSGGIAEDSTLAAMHGANVAKDKGDSYSEQAVESFIATAFGPGKTPLEDNFIAPLTNVKLDFFAKTKATPESADAIGKSTTPGIPIAFFSGKALKTYEIKNTMPDIGSKPTEKCKPDTKENECQKDKDCEHKDGKCKLKEGVKAENDGKTTNTTGSNSFVIKKTPLLLAFLLF